VPATLATPPSTPTSVLPIHSRARALLRPTCNATAQVAGRDEERARIQNFLANFLRPSDDTDLDAPTTLYISGSPGTGKTMLVNSILRDLDVDHPSVKVISLNCMAINDTDTLWDRLLEQFEAITKRKTVGRAAKAKGREAIDGLLSSTSVKWFEFVPRLSCK
jgi:cell division control protein 6